MKELTTKKTIFMINSVLGIIICLGSLIFYNNSKSMFSIFSFAIGLFMLIESFSHLNSIKKFADIRKNYQIEQIAEFSTEVRKSPRRRNLNDKEKEKINTLSQEEPSNEKSKTLFS